MNLTASPQDLAQAEELAVDGSVLARLIHDVRQAHKLKELFGTPEPKAQPSQFPALGTLLQEQGGFFHGVYLLDGTLYGEVTGPKDDCFVADMAWLKKEQDVPGAACDWDGLVNTWAMAEAGSQIAQAALNCRSGGHNDWYIAARGGLLLQYGIKAVLPDGEKFEQRAHWSSTQFGRDSAYFHYFDYGYASFNDKSWSGGAARFVRRFPILQFFGS